jgi:hypothetical protein
MGLVSCLYLCSLQSNRELNRKKYLSSKCGVESPRLGITMLSIGLFLATFTLAPEVFQNIGIGNSASSS